MLLCTLLLAVAPRRECVAADAPAPVASAPEQFRFYFEEQRSGAAVNGVTIMIIGAEEAAMTTILGSDESSVVDLPLSQVARAADGAVSCCKDGYYCSAWLIRAQPLSPYPNPASWPRLTPMRFGSGLRILVGSHSLTPTSGSSLPGNRGAIWA